MDFLCFNGHFCRCISIIHGFCSHTHTHIFIVRPAWKSESFVECIKWSSIILCFSAFPINKFPFSFYLCTDAKYKLALRIWAKYTYLCMIENIICFFFLLCSLHIRKWLSVKSTEHRYNNKIFCANNTARMLRSAMWW